MERHIDINQFDYDLPDERIAKFPLAERSASKLLVYRNGAISESRFDRLGEELPEGAMLVFNNTKVIRARIIMHKPSGARIEVFCLEPHAPADYERAFAVKGKCAWSCIVGNLKSGRKGALVIDFTLDGTPAATARLPHGHRRPRADRAVRVGGRPHVRRAARTAGTDSDSALPEPRQPADRLHALPDRLLQIRRFGGRADGGTALHPRTDRVARRRRRRVRRGDAPRRSRHLPSRQGRRRLPPRDAHRTFRDPPHDRRTAVAPLGPHRRRGHHLGTHARIAGGAGLAHPARRIARRNARGRPMGTLRRPCPPTPAAKRWKNCWPTWSGTTSAC